MAQLSFNESIRKDLAKSNDFQQVLNDLSKKDINKINNDDGRLIYLNIKSLLEQIKWNSSEKSQIITLNEEKNEHIMISYNKACKDVCLKIKDNPNYMLAKKNNGELKMSLTLDKDADSSKQQEKFRLSPVAKLVKMAVIVSLTSSFAFAANAQETNTESELLW